MSSKLRAIKRNGSENIEELAAQARAKRETDCNEEIQAVLSEHNCQMTIIVQLGEQMVPLNRILNLQAAVLIGTK